MAATAGGCIFQVSDKDYWKTYLEARPKYSREFYDNILGYHSAHSQTRDLAIDIGAGPGQVSEVFAHHFDRIIVSDLNEEHAAECIAMMDTRSAFESWHRVLRPGGTLAVWFYGRPLFVAADGTSWDAACNAAYSELVNQVYGDVTKATFAKDAGAKVFWQQTWNIMNSHLDIISVPEKDWSDVRRTLRNCEEDVEFAFWDPKHSGVEKIYACNVGPHETIDQLPDRAFWAEEWGIDEAKRFVSVNLPGLDSTKLDKDEEYIALLRQLEVALGGKQGKRTITWPVVLILATKR